MTAAPTVPTIAGSTLTRAAATMTVDAAFCERVIAHPERIALVQEARRTTYRELKDRVDRLCNALLQLGIQPGDRLAVLSENRCEYVEVLLAAAHIGAIVACQNWRLSATELGHCLQLVAPRVMFVSERHAALLAAANFAADSVVVLGPSYESLLARTAGESSTNQSSPEDGLLILYTSGTTGLPKGAVISHRAMLARAMIGTVDGQLYPGFGSICWSPLYHMGGTDPTLGTLMHGDTVFVVDGFQPAVLVEIMSRELLGNVTLVPASIAAVIAEVKRSGLRPRGIKACGSMADMVPAQQIAEITTLLNAPFRNTFGSTETGNPPASRQLIPIGTAPTNLSKTQSSYCQLRLVDDEGCDVPDGTPGEVLIRGPSLFSGYWNSPEVNEREFRGGWFHMGDVMVRNPDGTLDFVDRRKYLIKSGGENIYPAEIERLLLQDPRIADAAVVRKSDAHWGEVPVAFVVRADPQLSTDDVITLCRGRIANYKLPKEVRFVAAEDIPRSDTGKLKRVELEARLIRLDPPV
jgi:acyl-CoA synthetase (AMP-forming)/AMP-acid ligase II